MVDPVNTDESHFCTKDLADIVQYFMKIAEDMFLRFKLFFFIHEKKA